MEDGGLKRVSEIIGEELDIQVAVLMGANIADEVAREQFCEATVACIDPPTLNIYHQLFSSPYFRISCISDVVGVELCGALKNVVALAAGFVDGLGMGDNTKAAIIRIGLMEMRRFIKANSQTVADQTFFESCGVADLITTCFGGRNRRVAEAMVVTGKGLGELEVELLNGQKLQGPHAVKEIYRFVEEHHLQSEFPLFCAIYRICFERMDPKFLLKSI